MTGVPKDRTLPANGIPRLDTGDVATKIYYAEQLKMSDATAAVIAAYYANGLPILDERYDHSANPTAQAEAIAKLESLGVYHDVDKPCPTGAWFIVWSKNKDSKKNPAAWSFKRILIQCTCGYDHTKRGSKKRVCAFPLTHCPAHLEISLHPPTGAILRIRGLPDHNLDCASAMIEHRPREPIAPVVLKHAIEQVQSGARMRAVFRTNVELIRKCGYPGFPKDRAKDPHRWLLNQKKDTRTILRAFRRLGGVKVTQKSEENIDGWLDPQSRDFNRTIAEAVFHYHARLAKEERLEVCVATPEMEDAAWKYGHKGQLLLDGTFGVTDSRLLLFIVMVVDEEWKGVPAAFLIFSAPTGNQQSSAGYDTTVLTRLLTAWREQLDKSTRHSLLAARTAFTPCTAITDTDLKERGALLAVFIGIWLLICRFHLKQCWRNHRSQLLKGEGQLLSDLRSRMIHFEQLLLQQPDEAAACKFVAQEKSNLERTLKAANGGSLPAVATSVLKHLDYLGGGFWLRSGLFSSWSDAGRAEAAKRLRCPVDKVLTTTNHVEGFNGALKNSHLASWKRGGRRLRPDIFLNVLVTDIIPAVFESRQAAAEELAISRAKYASAPGGTELIARLSSQSPDLIPFVAYFPDDETRQIRGGDMVLARQIEIPTIDKLEQVTAFEFTCHSSNSLALEVDPITYVVQILLNGAANCECPDFLGHGWACKHIRGATALMEQLKRQGKLSIKVDDIPFPETCQQAIELQIRLGIVSRGRLTKLSAVETVASTLAGDLRESWGTMLNPESDSDEQGDADSEDVSESAVSKPSTPGLEEAEVSLSGPLTLPALELSLLSSPASAATPAHASPSDSFESQAHSRFMFELGKLQHTLDCCNDAFQSSSTPAPFNVADMARIEHLQKTFATLQDQLRLRNGVAGAMAPPDAGTSVPRTRLAHQFDQACAGSNKRARLLPPSPEKRQARKPSHSVV
ncbi:hypothetical protein GGX14DRAFT_394454 [Mycena pura]|uniref:SWIM-type domain-containing protein n=1 Tax=Mycena pura TaxID=153505 RepID=A0AAD6VIS7_9AGAR|nr:hypothetical protein GGX14DRAFT_394454 [Mycena pura]